VKDVVIAPSQRKAVPRTVIAADKRKRDRITYEYRCPEGHLTEKFFHTISEGAASDILVCPICEGTAVKIISAPLGFGLYGDPVGYDKPTTTKRWSTKTFFKDKGNEGFRG
jgi:hypothetical protein